MQKPTVRKVPVGGEFIAEKRMIANRREDIEKRETAEKREAVDRRKTANKREGASEDITAKTSSLC